MLTILILAAHHSVRVAHAAKRIFRLLVTVLAFEILHLVFSLLHPGSM